MFILKSKLKIIYLIFPTKTGFVSVDNHTGLSHASLFLPKHLIMVLMLSCCNGQAVSSSCSSISNKKKFKFALGRCNQFRYRHICIIPYQS